MVHKEQLTDADLSGHIATDPSDPERNFVAVVEPALKVLLPSGELRDPSPEELDAKLSTFARMLGEAGIKHLIPVGQVTVNFGETPISRAAGYSGPIFAPVEAFIGVRRQQPPEATLYTRVPLTKERLYGGQ